MPVTGYVELTFMFEREGNKWVGTCLELGTSTYGRTIERVEDSIYHLATEHLNLLEEAQERERFFRKHDITFHPMKPRLRSREVRLRVPASLGGTPRRRFFQPLVVGVPSATRHVAKVAAG